MYEHAWYGDQVFNIGADVYIVYERWIQIAGSLERSAP